MRLLHFFMLTLGVNLAFSQTISVTSKTYKEATLIDSVIKGDVLTHVVEIVNTGVNPSAPITFTDSLLGYQSFLQGTLNANGWTASNLPAWFNAGKRATASWNNLTPTSGSMNQMLGKNKFWGTGNIQVGDLSLGAGGDGYDPIVYVTPSGDVTVMAIHHHTGNKPGVVCFNISTNQSCVGSTTTATNIVAGNRSNGIIVGDKLYYPGANIQGGLYTATPALGCFDLSSLPTTLLPCSSPLYELGAAGHIIMDNIAGNGSHQIEHLVEVAGKIYTTYQEQSYINYLTCFDPATAGICAGYPVALETSPSNWFSKGYGYGGNIIPLGNNKIVISSSRYSGMSPICVNVATLTNCNGTTPISSLPSINTSPLDGTLTPTLSTTGQINGFCMADHWSMPCFDMDTYTDYNNSGGTLRYPNLELLNAYDAPTFSYQNDAYGMYLIDTANARIHIPRAFSSVGPSISCYDFVTKANCGNLTDPSAPYGIKKLPMSNCLVTYGDLAQFKFIAHDNNTLSYTNTCGRMVNFEWDAPIPASFYCDPIAETFAWDSLEVANLPAGHIGGKIEVLDNGGILLKTFVIPSAVSGLRFPSAGVLNDSIAYALHPDLRVRMQLNGLNNITQDADVYLSYTVSGNKKPQICFQTIVDSCLTLANPNYRLGNVGIVNGVSSRATAHQEVAIRRVITCVLPLNLLSFTAEKTGKNVNTLKWLTAEELNVSHYEIQRACSDGDFEYVAVLEAKGNGQGGVFTYDWQDNAPLSGLSRYRLRMVDFDGSADYSNEVELWRDKRNQMIIYPNPASEKIFILAEVLGDGYEIVCYNSLGQVVHKEKLSSDAMQNIEIPIQEWSAGAYLFSFEGSEARLQQKVIVK